MRGRGRCWSQPANCWLTASRARLHNAGALLGLRDSILSRIGDRATEDRWPPTPQRIVHDVREVIPEDGIVALDNGMYKIWFARNYRTYVANTLLLDNALATMGAGLPSAMMASMLLSRTPGPCRMRRRRLHDEFAGNGNRRSPQAKSRRPYS